MKTNPLVFTNRINEQQKCKLIEIPPELINDFESLIKKEGNQRSLSFKGQPHEEVVLCSKDKTYLIKEAPSSNNLLITDIKKDKYYVSKILNSTYVFEKMPPNLYVAYNLLVQTAYNGSYNEHKIDKSKLMDMEQIKQNIQASDEEIDEYLYELNVITLNGKLRIIEKEHLYEILDLILVTLTSLGINHRNIKEKGIFNSLEDSVIPLNLISHCLYSFTSINSDGTLALNQTKVSRFVAEIVMNKLKKPINFDEFIQNWKSQLPEDFDMSLDILNGLYYTDITYKNRIHPINPLLIPYDLKKRFQYIFSLKNPWPIEELKSIMEPILKNFSRMEKDSIYIKYCKFIIQGESTVLYKKLK